MSWLQSIWCRRLLALLAGAMLALAFPQPNIAGLAWVAPALLLLVARPGPAFHLGWLAGFAHHLVSLSWLLRIPVKFYPILGWLALATYLALFTGGWVWVCGKLRGSEHSPSTWSARLRLALLSAAAWVALEMIVARFLSGFPWNQVGASQLKLLPLIQVASVTGVYGVSFLVLWFAASLVNAVEALLARPAERQVWLRELALPILVVAVAYAVGLHRLATAPPAERTLRLALVQPSIPQTMIWNSEDSETRFRELIRLTEAALTNRPDVVVWPEAAVPNMIRNDEPTARALSRLAREHSAWFIIGSDDFEMRGTNAVYFNSSFLINPRGELAGSYRKRRLVIFGEYVPLRETLPFIKYLTPISGGFTPGVEPVEFALGDPGLRTSVLICFEDMFPHYAREHAGTNTDFLVNITNDGWFGEGAAQWQHAAGAAFRAVENGRPLVRCSNNGVTCWIDAQGRTWQTGFDHPQDTYRAGFKVVELPLPGRIQSTFYNRHGDVFGWSCVALTALAAGFQLRRAKPVSSAVTSSGGSSAGR